MKSQAKTPAREGGNGQEVNQAPALREILEKRIYEDKEIKVCRFGTGDVKVCVSDKVVASANIDNQRESSEIIDFEYDLASIFEETVERVVAEELELNIEDLTAEYDPDFADHIDVFFRDELLVSVKVGEYFSNQMTGYQRFESYTWRPLKQVVEDLKKELKPIKQLLSQVQVQLKELKRTGVVVVLLDKFLSTDFDVVKTFRSGNSNVVATTFDKDVKLKRYCLADFNIFKPL